jgi:hypothetical protein
MTILTSGGLKAAPHTTGGACADEFDRKGSGEAQQCAKLDRLFDGTNYLTTHIY